MSSAQPAPDALSREANAGGGQPTATNTCPTCGLSKPDGRRYCTAACRALQHRFSRASARVAALSATAIESEELDRPEFAAREWALVQAAIDRLAVMHDRIRSARRSAELPVPEDWP